MTNYIDPEYEMIENALKQYVEDNELNESKVKSLIRGSIEILDPEIPTASVVVIDGRDCSRGVSVKVKNIKINLKFTIGMIVRGIAVIGKKEIGLVGAMLNAIDYLVTGMTINFKREQAFVLLVIYRLGQASMERIEEEVKELKKKEEYADINIEDIREILKMLEQIKTIEMVENKYHVCESIYVHK